MRRGRMNELTVRRIGGELKLVSSDRRVEGEKTRKMR